ncbi:MAG: hypothetical protein FWF10_02365 [Clostridiales bacterium]|nr:hypothetical protein [Clostridiales bacterium]
MEISDNGRPPAKPVMEGGGIGGMRSKAAVLGGMLTVITEPRFVLRAELPGGDYV